MNTIHDGLKLKGRFSITCLDKDGNVKWEEDFPNQITDEGINHLLNVGFHGASQVTTWYIGLFEGNYTPVAGDTMATFVASATESTAYSEGTRQEFVEVASTAKSITNTASRAAFSINATKTLYGAFLASGSTKSATTGTLFAAKKFSTARSVASGDTVQVGYTLNAA